MAALLLVSACNDNVDIQQSYPFTVETMPVPKKLKVGETGGSTLPASPGTDGLRKQSISSAISSQRGGNAENVRWHGFLPNDLYPLPGETFRLYYPLHPANQQTVDVCFQDSLGSAAAYVFIQ